MNSAVGTVCVAPGILDGALAAVVDDDRQALAVWKGRNHIDLYALDGSWHAGVALDGRDGHATWGREEVLAQATAAVSSLALGPPPSSSASWAGQPLRVDVADLHRAWLVRARGSGYALWNGGEGVDVYGPDGLHRGQVAVTAAAGDLTTLSKLMLGLLSG